MMEEERARALYDLFTEAGESGDVTFAFQSPKGAVKDMEKGVSPVLNFPLKSEFLSSFGLLILNPTKSMIPLRGGFSKPSSKNEIFMLT